jgi:acetyltransferase EpsM
MSEAARRRLVILGGGEHARVVVEAIRAEPEAWDILGFVDPEAREETARALRMNRLGDDEWATQFIAREDVWLALGVGSVGPPTAREAIVTRFDAKGARWATIIHPRAWISPTASVEPGGQVLVGAVVNARAALGAHTLVNSGAIVEHDVYVEPLVHIAPGAVIGGGTFIGKGAYLGLGCRVRDHIRVGRGAVVGMGAVVVASVADAETVVGVPARPVEK